MRRILKHKQFGHDSRAIIILHGLFGRGRNWQQIAKALSRKMSVYCVDLRNHGASFQDPEMGYASMSRDVLTWMDANQLEHVELIGHSMGGKVAMHLALNHPHRFNSLISVDIAPVSYSTQAAFQHLINAMKALPLADISSRQQADAHLQAAIPDPAVRQFLLSNLYKQHEQYQWQFNLSAIAQNLQAISDFPSQKGVFEQPVLFLGGAASDYIQDQYRPVIKTYFPMYRYIRIKHAGHWLHSEQPEVFIRIAESFYQKIN